MLLTFCEINQGLGAWYEDGSGVCYYLETVTYQRRLQKVRDTCIHSVIDPLLGSFYKINIIPLSSK